MKTYMYTYLLYLGTCIDIPSRARVDLFSLSDLLRNETVFDFDKKQSGRSVRQRQ